MLDETLDPPAAERGWWRHLDARVKVAACLGVLLAGVTTPPEALGVPGAYLLFLLAGLLACGVRGPGILRHSLAVLPAVALLALGLPFLQTRAAEGEAAGLTPANWAFFWSALAKAALGVLAVGWLLATTTFTELLEALARLRVPAVFVLLAGLTYRYLHVFRDEAARMWRAREARCYGGRWVWQAGVAGAMLGTLFLRGYERGERVYLAMRARGFDGRPPGPPPAPLTLRDYAFLAGTLTVVLGVRLAAP